MTREKVLKTIAEARSKGERLDLRGAVLRLMDLRWLDLRGVDLTGADLRGASLRGTDLRGADLTDVDLRGVDLSWANLYGVPQILQVNNLPSGEAILVPTPKGWHLTVGCWTGTVDDLRELIDGDDWPEARGEEQDRRRPSLENLIDMCETHITYWPNLIDELKEKWGNY